MTLLLRTPWYTLALILRSFATWSRVATVVLMVIDEARWAHLQSAANTSDRGAPLAVVWSIADVVGEENIVASLPKVETAGQLTRWTCWVVTATVLGYVCVEYDFHLYDQHVEKSSIREPVTQIGTVRPLTNIIGMQYGKTSFDARAKPTSSYPLGPIRVMFPDTTIDVPNSQGFVVLSAEAAAEAEKLVRAIRNGAGF